MPTGRYLIEDAAGERGESFSCAPGPAGWRYVSTEVTPEAETTDVTVDARWRLVRLEVRRAAHVVRAGVDAGGLAWSRDGVPGAGEAAAVAAASPGLLVVRARALGSPAVGEARVLRVLRLHGPSLAPLTVQERWVLRAAQDHVTDLGPLRVEHWVVDDLLAGERCEVHLAGDVVLAAAGPAGSVTLDALEGRPSSGAPARR